MPFSFPDSAPDYVRDLLEDFDYVATRLHMALIRRAEVETSFGENIRTAVKASTMRVRSLDYARSRYIENAPAPERSDKHVPYVVAYKAAKDHVLTTIGKLRTEGRPDPTVGVFGASIVLERLPSSFFSAHLLYRLGHKYEGHAVARLILEQIAWAYAACKFDDMEVIERISPTHSVGLLKKLLPSVGRLYGFLSAKTHIDYCSHEEFLSVVENKNYVRHARADFREYAETILALADAHAVVWEYSQAAYIDEFESVAPGPDAEGILLAPNRPFIKTMAELLKHIPEPDAQ
ncbi:MAG: hypothetical protein AB7I35_04015 [Ramlibacter sp.]